MEGSSALVYLEQAIDAVDSLDDVLGSWLALAEERGANAGDIEVYADASAIRAARRFRHAVPSFMNERGSARTDATSVSARDGAARKARGAVSRMNPPSAITTTPTMTTYVFRDMSGNRGDRRATDNEARLVAVGIASRDRQSDLLRQHADRRDRFVGESRRLRSVHGEHAEQFRAGEDWRTDADAKSKRFGEVSEVTPTA